MNNLNVRITNLIKKYKDGSIEVLGKLASSKDLKIPKTFKIKA